MSDEEQSEKTTARPIGKYLLFGAMVVWGAAYIPYQLFSSGSGLSVALGIIWGLIMVVWGLYLFWTMKRVKR
jgi:hypothetical protein